MSYDYRYEACIVASRSAMYDKVEVLIVKCHIVRALQRVLQRKLLTQFELPWVRFIQIYRSPRPV